MFLEPPDKQAYELFLAEALELYQQVESGLFLLVREPNPSVVQKPAFQKVVHALQGIRQGANCLNLIDLEVQSAALEAVLYHGKEGTIQEPLNCPLNGQVVLPELSQHLFEGLQVSLRAHGFHLNPATPSELKEFAIHSLVPKGIETLESGLKEVLPCELYYQLILQQALALQYWHQIIDLPEIGTIADATLQALQAVPQAAKAIAAVALAGFQVAHLAILQRRVATTSIEADTEINHSEEIEAEINLSDFHPSETSLITLNIAPYLVGLAHQTVFCIATAKIAEILLPQLEQQVSESGMPQFWWRERLLPLIHLTDLWEDCPPLQGITIQQAPELILVLDHQPIPFALALEFDRLIVETSLELVQLEGAVSPIYRYGWTLMNGNWLEVVDANALLQQRFAPGSPWLTVFQTRQPFSTTLESLPKSLEDTHDEWATADHPQTQALLKTILIVDDSRTVREILSVTLQGAGYDVLQAQNGQEAIAHLQHHPSIQLTICDIEMSNLNGFEFLRHRLQDERWLKIPVLILSSHTSNEYRQLAQKLGAADYCTIPYDSANLLDKIDRLLQSIE